jgi:hypothetical protein
MDQTQTSKKIEELKAKQAALAKRVSALQSKQNSDARKADNHLKAALGGAVLALVRDKCHVDIGMILTIAKEGIQKQGLARERFEALSVEVHSQKLASERVNARA